MNDTPEDFSDALRVAKLDDFFADCSGPHRREYLQWITGAKRPGTRQARIKKAVQLLARKRTEEAARSGKTSR